MPVKDKSIYSLEALDAGCSSIFSTLFIESRCRV